MKKRRKRSQRGFTLVELMVSLTLFSFAIAGVLAVAVSMAQGYREQRQIVETESTARSALDFIADALRMTSPAVQNADVTTSDAAPAAGEPHLIVGNLEDTDSLATPNCAKGSVRIYNNTGTNATDMLEITYASGGSVTSVGTGGWTAGASSMNLTDTSNIAVGDSLLITNGTQGHIVKVATIPAAGSITVSTGACTLNLATAYNQGDLVIRVLRAKFYIGTFDSVSPTLIMDPDGDGAAPAEPLADYVEDMQIAVGVDEDQNDNIDAGEWGFASGGPTSFTLSRDLRAIRITLIARAPAGLPNTAAAFRRDAVEDHTAAATLDTFRRRVLTATVDVRNLSGSP